MRKGSAANEGTLKPEDGPLASRVTKCRNTLGKESQQQLNNCLSKGEFKNLSPYVDPEGVMRVDGRADKALVSYETRDLTGDHWISRLIIQYAHQLGHPGGGGDSG